MSKIPNHAIPSPAGVNLSHDASENLLEKLGPYAPDQFAGDLIDSLVLTVRQAEAAANAKH